ncbi:unnamed protein product [Cochlearia groenlandica]
MALIHGSVSPTSAVRLGFSTTASPPSRVATLAVPMPKSSKISRRRRVLRAMVQETEQRSPSVYARDMERLSAKESLLLALKDAGGFEALVTGKTTNMQRIDVNERITSLERLNPTPRPTTSPCLEGRWSFEWFGSGSPGLLAARVIFERFPSSLANLSRMEIVIKDDNAKATANIKLLNSIESKIVLSSKLTVEGPLRLREEYIEGMVESPTVIEEAVPEQLKGALGQATTTLQQLPDLIKDTLSNGLRIPLSGSFERFFMISYLDEEILIARDTSGVPEVLTRLESLSSSPSSVVETLEYDS